MLRATIAIPLFYNPDVNEKRETIEIEKIVRTCIEVAKRFGGCKLEGDAAVIQRLERLLELEALEENVKGVTLEQGRARLGIWLSENRLYIDPELKLEVHTGDDKDSRDWILGFAKNVLCQRFEQEAIYITFEHIEVDIVRGEEEEPSSR